MNEWRMMHHVTDQPVPASPFDLYMLTESTHSMTHYTVLYNKCVVCNALTHTSSYILHCLLELCVRSCTICVNIYSAAPSVDMSLHQSVFLLFSVGQCTSDSHSNLARWTYFISNKWLVMFYLVLLRIFHTLTWGLSLVVKTSTCPSLSWIRATCQ